MTVSWDSYFIEIAKVIATKSKDPHRKVGSVIVDKDNRIVSAGFNGFPSGYPDETVDWDNREWVRDWICHAEQNAILFARSSLVGCKLYTTLSPCCNCTKMAASAGIRTIVYKEEYLKSVPDNDYLEKLNISITKLSE